MEHQIPLWHRDRRLGRVYFSNEWYKGQIYRWENGKVTKTHLLSGRIRPSLRGRSRSRHRPHYHDPRSQWQGADGRMPAGTGHGHRAVPHRPPARNGRGAETSLVLPGTGCWCRETAKSSPMTLLSSSIGTPVKCCVSVRECSAGRKCSTLEYSPMARWSSSPGGIGLGRYFVIPSTSGASCGRQTSPKSWNGWSTKKCTQICPSSYRPRPQSEKSFSKKTA